MKQLPFIIWMTCYPVVLIIADTLKGEYPSLFRTFIRILIWFIVGAFLMHRDEPTKPT